jgi:hypothetical protein
VKLNQLNLSPGEGLLLLLDKWVSENYSIYCVYYISLFALATTSSNPTI